MRKARLFDHHTLRQNRASQPPRALVDRTTSYTNSAHRTSQTARKHRQNTQAWCKLCWDRPEFCCDSATKWRSGGQG
eukprot:3662804-Rhodomonas_salina.2